MSSNHTENIGLSQWLSTDEFRREDFNADNAAIDAAVTSCMRVMTGSYTGAGVYGISNKNSLTFDHTPKVVIIQCMGSETGGGYGTCVIIWGAKYPVMMTYSSDGTEVYPLQAVYSGNTVSWHSSSGVRYQLNLSDCTYSYAALY